MAYYSKDSHGNPRKGRNLDELLDKIQSSKIESGTITIGGDSITPITEHQDISGKANVGDSYTKQESDTKYSTKQELANKQDVLVSGTNIKTINSQSVLGSGNIEIQSSTQVNSDWNATSGVAEILNKPTIPPEVTETTVANWGFTKNTGTYSKPDGGIPSTDLSSAVQTSLGKADTALQEHQDITGKEDKNNKVTSWQSTPDNTHYPSEKLVKDSIDGVDNVFWAEYGVTTYQQVVAAASAGKLPVVIYNGFIYVYARENGGNIYFSTNMDARTWYVVIRSSNNSWTTGYYLLEQTNYKKTTITGNESSNSYYPTTKAVADYAQKKMEIVAASGTTLTAAINTYYNFASEVGTLDITFPAVTDTTHISNIVFMLTTGSTPAVTFTAPSGINVIAQDGFSIEASTTYEINAIFNGTTWVVAAMKLNTTDIQPSNP